MAAPQNFRSAFNGFNREDVVHYLEYLNTKHKNQVDQLTAENQELQAAAKRRPLVDQEELMEYVQTHSTELYDQLEAEKARCAELEEALASGGQLITTPDDELEVYRRAERAERLARERAAQIYAQANAVLADATVKVEAISDDMAGLYEQFSAKMQDGKAKLQDAVATLYAIKPEGEEDSQ